MSKYLSGRERKLNIGISSYTENQTVLDVTGNANVSGIATVGGISITGELYDSNNQVGTASSILVSTGTGVNWTSIENASLQGRQGVQGLEGDQGTQGLRGEQGTQGLANQGIQGNQGFKGDQGTQGLANQGIQGSQGTFGSQGFQGISGRDGNLGGSSFTYDFDTDTTDSDPGNGDLKFNNLNLTLATSLYIDDLTDNDQDIQQFLRSINNSTSAVKGNFNISQRTNTANSSLFSISSVIE